MKSSAHREVALGLLTKKLQAFTLLELLIVLSTLAFLACMLVPSRANTKSNSQAFGCLANTKRLMVANMMYQAENRELFPMVFHGPYVPEGPTNTPWVTGWLGWGSDSDNTNTLYLTDPKYASLAIYLGRSADVYRCPADMYASAPQIARGWNTRARSISANVYVGQGNVWSPELAAKTLLSV